MKKQQLFMLKSTRQSLFKMKLTGCLIAGIFTVGASSHLLAHGDVTEDVIHHRQMVEQEPGNVQHRIELAAAHASLGQYQEAMNQVQQVLQREPGNAEIRYQAAFFEKEAGDFNSAAKYIGDYLQLKPNDLAGVQLSADIHYRMKDYRVSAKQFLLVIEKGNAPYADLYLYAAESLDKIGMHEKALATLKQGVAKFGMAPHLVHALVKLQTQQGQFTAAIATMQQLIEVTPNPAANQLVLAELYQKSGNKQAAKQTLQKAIQGIDGLSLHVKNRPGIQNIRHQAEALLAALGQ